MPLASAVVAAFALGSTACVHAPVIAEPEPPAPSVEYLTQQEILTPLPLRVRLPTRYGADRVLVFFHTWGSRDWGTVELARAGQTWSGEISCREVSTVTGDTRYFFLAVDPNGDPVVGSGSPEWPHVATVVGTLPTGPQALAGDAVPMVCHDPSDCPPDFPGCPSYAFHRAACRSNGDCADGVRCAWDGYCGEAAAPSTSTEPPDAEELEARLAAAVKAARKKVRLSARR